MKRFRIGVVGFGWAANAIIRAIQLTKEDAETYLENRRQECFNSAVVNLLE